MEKIENSREMENVLKEMLKIQMEQQQHNLAIQQLVKNLATSQNDTKHDSVEFLIESLGSNITEFNFDEHNLTFEMWYARYEDLFEVDAAKLDDAAKVASC